MSWWEAYEAVGHAVVVCAGDVGRSPRMCYHALSLAEDGGFAVTLVGYAGERCFEAIESEGRIRQIRVDAFEPKEDFFVVGFPTSLKRLCKVFVLLWRLGCALLLRARQTATEKRNRTLRVSVVVAQTPPAIPTLFVSWLLASWTGALFVIDWHNLGFTLLAEAARSRLALRRRAQLPLGERVAEGAYRFLERLSARLGDRHLCVSSAMATWLASEFKCRDVVVARDRPPRFFQGEKDSQENFDTLRRKLPTLLAFDSEERPGLLVSSTSWSPDEDFKILLAALALYDRGKRNNKPLLVVVTGKGSMRNAFEAEVKALNLKRVKARCAWLDAADYVSLLRVADAGVCLHASSSGLDLPMKVVDMFGAHLPVLALDFPALPELVVHNHNGLVFQDATTLANHLHTIFHTKDTLQQLKVNANFHESWHAMWRRAVLPVVRSSKRRR